MGIDDSDNVPAFLFSDAFFINECGGGEDLRRTLFLQGEIVIMKCITAQGMIIVVESGKRKAEKYETKRARKLRDMRFLCV